MQVDLEQRPAMRAAGVRHIGPYMQINQAFAKLGEIAGPAGLFNHPGAAMIGVYYDDPQSTPADRLRSDAAVVVADGIPIPPGLTELRIPGGRFACTIHRGSYERLGETWSRLMGEWIPAHNLRVADGQSYERYINNPAQVPTEQLETEICVPVE
jgi:AraC family transcriptional regulator